MARSDLLTVVAVALLAYALDDGIHEVVGHVSACAVLGVHMLGLSTIGLQTASSSRLVAAAGSIANVLAGITCAALLARGRGFGTMRYFVWLLAFVNLMNGTGYLMASALTNSGDWAVVIAGLKPALAWRAALGALGVVTFAASVRWATGVMREWVAHAEVALADVARLTWVPYLAGGLMFALASVFNPVGPAMILTSGIAASFGLTFGLLTVAGGSFSPPVRPSEALPLQRSWSWIVVGLVVAALFIGVLGPGVHF